MSKIDDSDVQLERSSQDKNETAYRGSSQPRHDEIAARTTSLKGEPSADLKTVVRLHELSTRFLGTNELQPLLEEILDAAIELLHGDFGALQLYDRESRSLQFVAHRGFKRDFLNYFSRVTDESAACGRALNRRARVIIEDVNTDPGFAPHRHVAASAGFRAVQSTPLFNRGGETLGMISTHFREPHIPSEHELRFMDLYAHLAAELIDRQRTLEALSASERRFRRYFELGLIGMAISAPTKIILEVNAELCRILGYERHELLQKSWIELSDPEDLAADLEHFNRVIAGEIDEYTLDKRLIRKDGQIIHSIMSAKCVRRADGSVDYFLALVQDITARKQTEERLREYERAVEGLEEMIVVVDREYRYRIANRAFLHYRGLEGQQLAGRLVPDLLNSRLWNEVTKKKLDEALEGKIVTYELSHVFPKVGERHLFISYFPIEGPHGIDRVACVLQDITERKRAEEQVRKAHERVDMLLESISDNFFALDSEGRFTYFNKHAAQQMKALGKDPDALIGKVSWEEFPDMPNYVDVKRVLSERVVVVDEIYYEPLQEWLENYMYPSNDGGLVVFQRYITERKRTEEELRKTQAELAHVTRLTTVGELTASIAHEVNQPLGAIVTNGHACLHLLSRDRPDLDEVRQALESIITDGMRASEVIKRIRRLLKKSSGGKSLHSINNMVREVLALVASELVRNNINVQTRLAVRLPFVVADRIQIQQVVLNLILNSKEAMSVNGPEARDLMVRTEQTGPEVMVTVADTGVGIATEDRERAFEPFFTTKDGGLGLGLSISKRIIEAHGGRLWIEPSQTGQGTTFQFTLPIGENVHRA